MLTLLAVLALPMQTAAHLSQHELVTQGKDYPNGVEWSAESGEHRGRKPRTSLSDIIQWIRIYKNPETVPKSQLQPDGNYAGHPLFTFEEFGITGLSTFLYPSYRGPDYSATDAQNPNIEWVKFNPTNHPDDPGGLIDKGDNSGLVTATENTSVKVGDTVAIAIRVKNLGYRAFPEIAIGPLNRQKAYTTRISGEIRTIPRPERKWRLSPNLPIRPHVNQLPVPMRVGYEHTLVYHFKVTADHAAALNADGPWLKSDFDPYVPYVSTGRYQDEPFHAGRLWEFNSNKAPEEPPRTDDTKLDPPGNIVEQTVGMNTERVAMAFEWLYGDPPIGGRNKNIGHPDPTSRPSPTSLKPFNTFTWDTRYLERWGVEAGTGADPAGPNPGSPVRGWAYHLVSNSQPTRNAGNFRTDLLYYTHYHVPRYDPALPGKDAIFYPKIEEVGSRAQTTMDVPGGTQTGEFTVTLRFADSGGTIFEGHDLSPKGLESFKTALTAAFAETAWTVKSLSVEDDKRPKVASSGAEITPYSPFTEYQLTLSPPLGAKGAFALQIPENIVMDVGDNGNDASASVMVEVDTPLQLASGQAVEIAAPEAGAYQADDALEVLVPFAEEGLTYEGDDPPYITIYLGEGTENPRHATWQRGEESAGSTIVPFKYVIAATDPIVSSVTPDTAAGVLIPTGTKLMSRSGRSSLVGTEPPAMASGEKAPVPDATNKAGFATSTGAAVPSPEVEVQVLPAVYLPPTEESAPKAGMSSIPRSPIVFNELGNGSGDTNDWLELRNVTGDAVSLKDWELSVVQDGKKEDTSLVVFPDVSVPAEGLLLITNSDPTADGNLLSGGDDIDTAKAEVKGSSHLYLVNAGLSLPDDGQFLLILRKAKEKLGLNEAFVDVAGGGGSGTDAFVREQEGDYDTYVWPLQVLEAPGSATEDALSSGKVWLRAKADIVGYHRDAWAEAAFTGVGYDRKVSKSAETAGTPGYPNGAVKTEAATPRGAITISEVMLDSAGGTLPQWVELYNASKTDALNLNRWELEIQNVDSEDLVGRPIVRLTLQEKVIQPNQTLLIVTGNARASSADVYPADRIYNLLELHDKNLRIKKPSDTFLSAKGFYLRLTDRNEHLVDEVGNTDGNRRTDDTPAWALPMPLSELEGMRSSLIRRYDKGVARDGKEKSSWALAANFAKFKAAELHYGHADDIGTPGYRQGGALPVELSSFTVTRLESGSVIVTWTTESEVDNAGFNLRRSLTRDSGFTLLNPALIAGAGTTGERQTYTFIDTSAKPGVEHYYQIEEVSFGGKAETLVTRRLRGPVSPAHRALKTLGEVKQRDE